MITLFKLLDQATPLSHSLNDLLYPLIVGYKLVPQKGAHWVIDDMKGEHTIRHTIPIQSKKVTLYQLPHRYCTGSYNLLTMESCPCPHKKSISPHKQKCNYCQKISGISTNFAKPSSWQQKAHEKLPHDVYLAYFIPGIVKVGIAYHDHLYTSLLEEGAQAALVIHESPNAYEASMLAEEIIALGIQSKIKAHQKATWVAHMPYQRSVAREQLQATREKLYEKLGDRIAYTPTIYEFQYTYWPNGIPKNVSLGSHLPEKITGTVAGMVGSLLALYTSPTKCLLLETKSGLGRLLLELH